jgi:hypothetical protein
LALTELSNANLFLAAFSAGITIATVGPEVRDAFHQFGDLVAELLKLSALLAARGGSRPRAKPRSPKNSPKALTQAQK